MCSSDLVMMATLGRKLTQAGKPYDQPDLETVRDRLPIFTADEPEQIVDAFEASLTSLSQASLSVSVQDAAQALVTKIQAILPLEADKNMQEFLLENLAWLFIRIAQQIPSRHIGQELLVKTVQLIKDLPEETWLKRFLGSLRMNMRDGWSGFTTDDGEDEDDVQTPDEWLNLNSFNARLFGSGMTRWYNMAIWELREALETELGPKLYDNDCRIAVASEWIIQAGPKLLRESLLGADLTDGEKRAFSGGSLWTGIPGLSTERWGFWKRRLSEVKETVGIQLTLDYLEHAERVMTAVERDLALSIP